jgi:hypothetical protein
MHGSISTIPSKKSCPHIHDVKFLALIGAPYIYDMGRLRVKSPLIFYCYIILRKMAKNDVPSSIMTLQDDPIY